MQVGVAALVNGVATAAGTTGALRSGRLAKPCFCKRIGEFVLSKACRPAEHEGVSALLSQCDELFLQPWRERRGCLIRCFAHNPRAVRAVCKSVQTASGAWLPLIRTKRSGAAAARAA